MQILIAAKDTFLELGYAAASMDQVAQRARVSKTTLYTRFPSKEALFAATISAECERRGMRFQPEDFDDLPLEEALRAIARRFLDLIWSPEAIQVQQTVTGEAARFPEVARIFFDAGPAHGRAAVAAFFAHAAARGVARVDDPEFTAQQFMGALQGGPHCELTLCLCAPPSGEERESHIRKAVALFVTGVGAAVAAAPH
ncbi:MAG TPA: TetR/AcrR family transcriptional regulator [Azospirillaceae bacterium]|nr:TetR/AcrR family transcriptional regulator [Azospirillaceae bacterium]